MIRALSPEADAESNVANLPRRGNRFSLAAFGAARLPPLKRAKSAGH
jgi:hypothetical protein